MNTNIPTYKAISLFILAACFLCYEMAVQVAPGIITHQLMHDLKMNALGLGFMSGFYYITYTLMQIPAGLLYDRFNIRLVIVFPLLLCILGTALFGFAHSVVDASLARLLMGAGGAFAFIGVLVVAADVFPKRHFALLAGLAQMLAAFGAMFGQLPLLSIVHWLGWRHAMLILALVGLILVILISLFLRYKKAPNPYCPTEPTPKITHSLKVIAHNRQTWLIAIYACCLWASMAAFGSLWGVPYLMEAYHLSRTSAAGIISAMWLGIAIGAPLLGWWSDSIKNRRTPLITASIVGFIAFSLVLLFNHIPLWSLSLLIFLSGAACSGQALSFALVHDNNRHHNQAAAIGFNNMAVVIAGALFQPLIGKLIQIHWSLQPVLSHGKPLYLANDYRYGLATLSLCFFIGIIISVFFLKESSAS